MADLIGRLIDRGRGDGGGLRPRIEPAWKPTEAMPAGAEAPVGIEPLAPRSRLFSPQPAEVADAERVPKTAAPRASSIADPRQGEGAPRNVVPVEPRSGGTEGKVASRTLESLEAESRGHPDGPPIDPTHRSPVSSRVVSGATPFGTMESEPPDLQEGEPPSVAIAPRPDPEPNRMEAAGRGDASSHARVSPITPRGMVGEASVNHRESEEDSRAGGAAPTVQVRIGRIEVRAVLDRPLPPPAARPRGTALSLEAYLRERSRGYR
jgi:hypothetical protein